MTKKRREIMICSDCQGEGVTPLWIAGSFEELETCERCNGSGRVVVLTSVDKEAFRPNDIIREKK
jgi:DnaJ-class molecular chaperone